jgi:hypothetical protein
MLNTNDLVQDAIINAPRNLDLLEIRSEGALQACLRNAPASLTCRARPRAARPYRPAMFARDQSVVS